MLGMLPPHTSLDVKPSAAKLQTFTSGSSPCALALMQFSQRPTHVMLSSVESPIKTSALPLATGTFLQQAASLLLPIIIIRMGKESALWIGTVVFTLIGLSAAVVFWVYVGMKSSPALKSANRSVAMVSVFIAVLSMWIMWICTYMHQMNPLIAPILMVSEKK